MEEKNEAAKQLKAIKNLLILIVVLAMFVITNPNELKDYGYTEYTEYVRVKNYHLFSVVESSYGGTWDEWEQKYINSKWKATGFGILGITFGDKKY